MPKNILVLLDYKIQMLGKPLLLVFQLLGKPGIVRCVKSNEGKTDRVKIEHHGKDNFWWSKDALILVAKGGEFPFK